jgi:putative ABC transport system permease protein
MNLLQDVRFGFRMLAKDTGFTAIVLITLALGIGANTTIFTLVNAVLFKGLPFERADRVVSIASMNLKKGRNRMGVSYPDFADWRAHSRKFQALAAYSTFSATLNDAGGVPERYDGARMTANSFSLIGQKPLLGRDFSPEEDSRQAAPVVILGYSIWKNRYGSDPNILGKTVRVNEVGATIIGVMPNGMRFPRNNDLWLPLVPTGNWEKRESRGLGVFGRLADSANLPQAGTEMEQIAKTLEKEYPKSNVGIGALVQSYNDSENGGPIRTVFLALLGAVVFVLLIACANVANLLLARSASRAKEISIRTALGASRWRVVRQLLIESVLLGVIGGSIGLLLSVWGVRMFDLAVANSGKPYWIVFKFDYTVFAYFAGLCVGAGILFGLAPALHISKLDVNETLKEGGRGSSAGSRIKYLSGFMVVSELALALVLLIGAGLMIRSFLKLYGLDTGVNPNNLLTMRYNLPDLKYPTPESRAAFHERLMPRLASIPGVESVALTTNLPLQGSANYPFELQGQAPVEADKRPTVSALTITSKYFQTVGAQVIRGRSFDDSDGAPGKPSVIVNKRFAAKYWPADDPLGKKIHLIREPDLPWLTVVGVCPDITQNDPNKVDIDPIVYVPFRQDPRGGAAIVARTRTAPNSLIPAFRKEVRGVDEDLPIFEAKTMQDFLVDRRWPFRVFGSLFAIFALIALVLSSVGIYAVMAYSVNRRTQEIGVRMALGATTGNVLRLVLSLGLKQLAIGLVIGLAAAFGLTRVLSALLMRVSPTDPLTFAGISVLLIAIGVIACWIPARRAAKIDPMVALRYE